jgi:hypothetical protein
MQKISLFDQSGDRWAMKQTVWITDDQQARLPSSMR